MNAFVRKEIRLLQPSFFAALALAASLWLVPANASQGSDLTSLMLGLPFLLCPAMLILMAIGTFGKEISGGTFTNLMAQPVSRAQVWRTKTTLLALAVSIVALVWWLSYRLSTPNSLDGESTGGMALGVVLVSLAVFSGGLWSVLLLRQVVAAFWFTFLTPAMLVIGLGHVFENNEAMFRTAVSWTLGVYAVVGFLWARWLFLRAQDVHWTGGTLMLPAMGIRANWLTGDGARREWNAQGALVAKEFRLHQSTLLIAGLMALIHLVVRGIRVMGTEHQESAVLEVLLNQFWVFWLFMPVLVGCTSVAEERKLGTLDSQLCLPVRPGRQLVIKLGTVITLSLLLGLCMPLLLDFDQILKDVRQSPVQLLIAVVSWSFIATYASSLARNTLQALAPAVLGTLLMGGLLIAAVQGASMHGHTWWQGTLILWIAVPVALTVLGTLLVRNFRQPQVDAAMWRYNTGRVVGAILGVVTLTAAIYNRAWELVTFSEPAHGTAVWNGPQPAALSIHGNWAVARLPDGHVWLNRFMPQEPTGSGRFTGDWTLSEVLPGGRVLEGTNWTSVAAIHLDIVAIAKDGSLWASEQSEDSLTFWKQQPARPEPIKLVRIGTGNDWKTAVGSYPPLFLLKTDGTLWTLGTNRVNSKWVSLRTMEPRRVDTTADWTDISVLDHRLCFRRRDGTAWVTSGYGETKDERFMLGNTLLVRAPHLEGRRWRGHAWVQAPQRGSIRVGVGDDGTFRMSGAWGPDNRGIGQWSLHAHDILLGHETNWLATIGEPGSERAATLRADGTLWKWSFAGDPVEHPEEARSRRFSTHQDWVAAANLFGGLLALSGDGSLWFWESEIRSFTPSQSEWRPLLAASRKPMRVGNVFGVRRP